MPIQAQFSCSAKGVFLNSLMQLLLACAAACPELCYTLSIANHRSAQLVTLVDGILVKLAWSSTSDQLTGAVLITVGSLLSFAPTGI